MEPLLGLTVAAIAAAVAYLVTSARRRAHRVAWRAAATRVGLASLEEVEGGTFEGARLSGGSGALSVRLEAYRRGKYERGTKVVVAGLGHGAGGLTLRREGLATAFEKNIVGEKEIEIGDPAFDQEYYLQGPGPLAVAILDSQTRRRLSGLLRGRVAVPGREPVEVDASLANGVLEVRLKESGFSSGKERLPEVLAEALEVARALVAPKDVAARIGANLGSEPEPGARLRGLLTLAREFGSHPATRPALLDGLDDRSEEVRLRAAGFLGEDGRATLLDLVTRTGTSDACAARAIEELGERLPTELAEATLRRALGGAGRPLTAQACLEALGRQGRSEAQGLMIEALRDPDAAVMTTAARALGRAGTVDAVAAVREAMPPRGELLRSVGRQAIAEIHARLAGAEPGQLSLAKGESGRLSLVEERRHGGEVSLTGEAAAPEPRARRAESIANVEEEPEAPRPQRPGTIQGKT